jgi:hypothetical protein
MMKEKIMKPRKIDILVKLMLEEKWDDALSLASKFPELGKHTKAIRMAHDANFNPRFYIQLGKNPEVLRQEGINALIERYDKAVNSHINSLCESAA